MDDLDCDSVKYLRTWLSNRRQLNDDIDHYQTNVIIHSNDQLRSLGFPDLHLDRYRSPAVKSPIKFDLNQLCKWMNQFLALMRTNRTYLETIELLRNNFNKKLSRFHVQEAIDLVQCASSFDVALDIEVNHIDCILIEDLLTPTYEILRQICVRLFAQCSFKVVAKVSHYYTCLATAFLLDMMEDAGFPVKMIELLVYDQRHDSPPTSMPANVSSIENAGLSWYVSPAMKQQNKLSTMAICFNGSNQSLAVKSIIETYLLLQRQYPNMIVLVEESIYELFIYEWHVNYTNLTMPADGDSWPEIQVDLNSIDLKSAHRMTGHCINVIKFRSIEELCKLMNKLRKIPHLQLWTNNHLFAREISLSNAGLINQCDLFWLNHCPRALAGRQFPEQLIKFYKLSVRKHMNDIYTDLFYTYEDEIERLRKLQSTFMNKKSPGTRNQQVIRTYLNLITKFKSMKQTSMSVAESVVRMKRFQLNWSNQTGGAWNESRIESTLKPVGLAILVIRNENCVKSKTVLIEFIFKNLIIGNGIFLLCSQSLLSTRFPMSLMERYCLPFAMVNLSSALPPISEFSQMSPAPSETLTSNVANNTTITTKLPHNTSVESVDSGLNDSCALRKALKCPKGIFAVEFKQAELTSDKVETMIIALGTKRKSIWYPEGYQYRSQFSSETSEESS